MSVFISWSNTKSKSVATALRRLIDECLCPVPVWMSAVDMEAGVKLYEEIERYLGEAKVGIVCITDENLKSPWVLFEAGAMLKAGRLVPYLIGIADHDLPGPLSPYQACPATRDGTLSVLRAVNSTSLSSIDERLLERRFDAFWPSADQAINQTSPTTSDLDVGLGVDAILRNRSEAFHLFVDYLRSEVHQSGPKSRLWIIGSSLQGFDVVASTITIWDAIDAAVPSGCLRVLLTAPEVSHFREKPEDRIPGQIKGEIGVALNKLLESHRIPAEFIRLYPGSPTVTAIATSTHMFLNPFPYGLSSFHCFSLIVRKTSDETDIYNQYIAAHFEKGWKLSRPLTQEDIALTQRHNDVTQKNKKLNPSNRPTRRSS